MIQIYAVQCFDVCVFHDDDEVSKIFFVHFYALEDSDSWRDR